MRVFLPVLFIAFLSVFSSSCPKEPTIEPDIDFHEVDAQDVEPLPDVDAVSEVDAEPPPQNAPLLNFYFVVKEGPIGLGSEKVALSSADEPEKYKEIAGFQIDVVVKTLYLENGRDIELFVQGHKIKTEKVTVDPQTGEGTAEFLEVTLTHSLSGYEVRVEATNLAGLSGFAAKTVTVDTGKCGVDLFPKNTACLLADENPDLSGFQKRFVVINPDKTCDKAKITVDINGILIETAPADLDEAGQVEIEVKLSDEATGLNSTQVKIMASVIDSAHPDRNESSPFYDYTIDTEDPVVIITSPTKTSFNLQDDKDQDPANGINLDFAGKVTGLPSAGEVELLINEQSYGKVATDPEGNFLFENIAFKLDGLHVLKFRAFDSCGREGFVTLDLVMNVSKAILMFVFPTDQQVLYAMDDKVLETMNVYEVDFKIYGESMALGNKLVVKCRDNVLGSVFFQVGSLTVSEIPENLIFTVPVSLSVVNISNAYKICFAEYIAPNPAQSPEIEITVALPPPLLKILTPAENALTNKVALSVSLFAKNLDGVSPSSKIMDLNDNLILEYQTPKKIANNGILYTVPLIVAGAPIPDGTYRLVVDALDLFGNKASDIPTNDVVNLFRLDTSPPVLNFIEPVKDKLEPAIYNEDADEEPLTPGYQRTVKISVLEGDLEGVIVCLNVNSQGDDCLTMSGAEQYAEWKGVTLLAGDNELRAYAIDNAKNKSADIVKNVFADIEGLRVEIISPAKNGPIGELPFTLKVLVSDKDTLLLVQNAFVKLFQNGIEIAQDTTGDDGMTEFLITSLDPDVNDFYAYAELSGIEGYSSIRSVYLKTESPVAVLSVPSPALEVINSLSDFCKLGEADCIVDVTFATQNVEDGSQAELIVNCGTSEVIHHAEVFNNSAIFENVVLLNQKTCEISGKVTDLVGKTANVAPLSFLIDRTIPVINSFKKPITPSLSYKDDLDHITPGLQYKMQVNIKGVEKGQTVTIKVSGETNPPFEVSAVVPMNVGDDQYLNIDFPEVTFYDDIYTLRANVSDKNGNPAVELVKVVNVIVDKPIIRFTAPAYIDNISCTTSTECGAGGYCAKGKCAIPWNKLSSKNLFLSSKNIPDGTDNLQICSNNPLVTGEFCNTFGYKRVLLTSMTGNFKEVNLAGALIDGYHTLIAEAFFMSGEPWVTTLEAASYYDQRRHIYQDTVPPAVISLSSPSDTEPPTNYLNIAEQKATPRIYELSATASEGGSAVFYVNGVPSGTISAPLGTANFDATLKEGGNEIYVVFRDGVGNYSPAPPNPGVLYYLPTVDTTPPTISFLNPVKTPVISGESLDIVVGSNAIGQSVTLRKNGNFVASLPVQPNGIVIFPHTVYGVLTEGYHTLKVEVADFAGNQSETEISVFVDTVLPDITLLLPDDLQEYTDAHDEEPYIGGFQLKVIFGAISNDSDTWRVLLASNCDDQYLNCDPFEEMAAGDITNPGGLEPDLILTVPIIAEVGYYKLKLEVRDASGNLSSFVVKIKISLSECIMRLTGLPGSGYYNNSYCQIAGENCESINRVVTAQFAGPCGNIDTIKLLKNGSLVESKPVTNYMAEFNLTLTDGETFTLQAKGYEGAVEKAASGVSNLTVDLLDPVPLFVSTTVGGFTTPASSSNNIYNASHDLSGATDFQMNLRLEATDVNIIGGQLVSLTTDFGSGEFALTPSNVSLPYAITASPLIINLLNVTLKDQKSHTVKAVVRDKAGNIAESTFNAIVDLLPPGNITLQEIAAAVVNVRKPLVTLRWTASGDNGYEGGTAAVEYDIRFSKFPITDAFTFNDACRVTNLAYTPAIPSPKQSGESEAFSIKGPDVRSGTEVIENGQDCRFATGFYIDDFYFAVRAKDDAGNWSDITVGDVASTSLSLRSAKISGEGGYAHIDFQRRIYAVGDVNNDGMADLGIGGGNPTPNAFCIVYGNSSGVDLTVSDLLISSDTGTNHKCLTGSNRFGTPIAGIGDVNGDGIDDFAVGEGLFGGPTSVKVFFGKQDQQFSSTPNITIIGLKNSVIGARIGVKGNFNNDYHNGKPLFDILVGSAGTNRSYLIPGSATWNEWTNITIDVQNATDLTTYKVVTFRNSDGASTAYFGSFLSFVGDVNNDNYDEVAIAQDGDTTKVFVFKGRDVASTVELAVSNNNIGLPEDANVVRLRGDYGTLTNSFGSYLSGGADFDNDERKDLVIGHAVASTSQPPHNKSIYLFYGSAIATALGSELRINATVQIGDNIWQNNKGLTIRGAYDSPVVIGNFDDETSANPSFDLAYKIYSTTAFGQVFIRLNIKKPGGFDYGSFPYEFPVIRNPYNVGDPKFGHIFVAPIGDFNGDGFVDLGVGTNGSGYAIIIY